MKELDMNWELLANKDYAFLTESPLLGNNILLLTLGGSHAYGTNVETSDIDVRGITYNPLILCLETEFLSSTKTRQQIPLYMD